MVYNISLVLMIQWNNHNIARVRGLRGSCNECFRVAVGF